LAHDTEVADKIGDVREMISLLKDDVVVVVAAAVAGIAVVPLPLLIKDEEVAMDETCIPEALLLLLVGAEALSAKDSRETVQVVHSLPLPTNNKDEVLVPETGVTMAGCT